VIGVVESIFKEKNGTPRQGLLCKHTRACITIDIGSENPEHSLEGLQSWSHVWLVFMFHDNRDSSIKNKVRPPRLEDSKIGVFATRSPHRPNAIGLSVAKIEKIVSATLYLSGIDLIDGTPILDIKPYVPEYDLIPNSISPDWIKQPPRAPLKSVTFTTEVDKILEEFLPILEFYDNLLDLKCAIQEILILDPRSTFFRKKNALDVYGFCIDNLNILCTFTDEGLVSVIGAEDWSSRYSKRSKKCQNNLWNSKK